MLGVSVSRVRATSPGLDLAALVLKPFSAFGKVEQGHPHDVVRAGAKQHGEHL